MNPIMYNEYKLSNLEYIIYGFLFLTISFLFPVCPSIFGLSAVTFASGADSSLYCSSVICFIPFRPL